MQIDPIVADIHRAREQFAARFGSKLTAIIKDVLPLLGAVMLLGRCQKVAGDEPPSKQETTKNYAQLISQLVSPNKEATTQNGADSKVKFPIGYDVAAQKRIEALRQVLHDDIENALPYLVGALDDQRYCMTINWMDGDAYYNFSVGTICRNVIASHLEVYREEISFFGSGHWNRYNYPISKKWWDERKGRRLSELQVEAIDWAIEKRKAEPKEFTEGRENEIAELQNLRATIAKSGKPAPSQRMRRMVTQDR